MQDNNISTSIIKVFNILEKLYISDCEKIDLLENYSEDTLYLYLKTLKQLGITYKSPNKSSKYYSLKSGLNFLNITPNDIILLKQIKEILSQKATYHDIINFNNLLLKLKKYTNMQFAEELEKIMSSGCVDIANHEKISEIEHYIEQKQLLKINYIQPASKQKSFIVLPKYIKQEKSKLYLLCEDNSLNDLRCLKISRIKSFEKIKIENWKQHNDKNYAICEFYTNEYEQLLWNVNYEIIEQNTTKVIVKLYFHNIFEFMQKILSFGNVAKVLAPQQIQDKIIEQLGLINDKYAV